MTPLLIFTITYMLVRQSLVKVKAPKTNIHSKTNTMYHMHTLGASKCMLVVHSVGIAMGVGFGGFYLLSITCIASVSAKSCKCYVFGQNKFEVV